jgi:hypothetical protein
VPAAGEPAEYPSDEALLERPASPDAVELVDGGALELLAELDEVDDGASALLAG